MNTSIIDLMAVEQEVRDLDWLQGALQAAIELELSTLPVYLCGMWSIKAGSKDVVYQIIKSVVIEEMLHMGLACNMLTAIGGSPQIDQNTMPIYPGGLPGGVVPGLNVSLAGLSPDQVRYVYMEIEYPESGPIDPDDRSKLPRETNTIGQFYDQILDVFNGLQPTFTGTNQITPDLGLFAITSLVDVQKAISTIKDQGEGTSTSPEDGDANGDANNEMAHFYKFSEIWHGHSLVQQDGVWQYTGAAIPFPEVYPMPAIPAGGYSNAGTDVRIALNDFNSTFSTLLAQLESAWRAGSKPSLNAAINTMGDLGSLATAVMAFQLPDGTGCYGPEFLPVQILQ